MAEEGFRSPYLLHHSGDLTGSDLPGSPPPLISGARAGMRTASKHCAYTVSRRASVHRLPACLLPEFFPMQIRYAAVSAITPYQEVPPC